MKKKVITKGKICTVYALTIDTIPHLEVRGTTHFERMIKWFESNDYNITNNSVNNMYKHIQQRKEVMKQLSELALNDFNNNVKDK